MNKKVLVGVIPAFIIILISSSLFVFNINFYDRKFEKYGVYEEFEKEYALDTMSSMLDYIQDKAPAPELMENEVSHLDDVAYLIGKARTAYFASLAVFWGLLIILYLFDRKNFVMSFFDLMLYSGIFTFAVLVFFGLLYIIFGFDMVFTGLHEIFFEGNYAFNPTVSVMKALLPNQIFRDMGVRIFLTTLVKSLILCVVAFKRPKNL